MSAKKHKFTVLIIQTLFILSLFTFKSNANAQTLEFHDLFEGNDINSTWEVKNFVHPENGSFADHSELNVTKIPDYTRFSGTAIHETVFEDGHDVGWAGRSLILNEEFVENHTIIIETSTIIYEASYKYQTHITIEFDRDNRIVFSLGKKPGYMSELVFDENDTIRCVGGPEDDENQSGCLSLYTPHGFQIPYKLTLIFNSDTKRVLGYINDIVVHAGTYQGTTSNFKVGLAASVRGPGDYADIWFDYFKVYGEGVEQPVMLNVPDIKQYSPPWGSQIYDNANSWYPSSPWISRWGCAMTSATMVLNYHANYCDPNNLLVTPEGLNTWLKNNHGYTRNGGVIWPAISRYSKLNPSFPTLEFSYHNYNDVATKTEIDNEHPPILKLLNTSYGGNHFIVGKGYDSSDIFVNDPGSATNNTLSDTTSYWGNAIKIGKFTPSNTDLSYIVLFVDEDFDISVSSESTEIAGSEYYFKEDPIQAADGEGGGPADPPETSGETLSAFYYPKPEDGVYEVIINGEGEYTLDAYLYDESGNIVVENIEGNTDDEFELIKIYYQNGSRLIVPISDEGFDILLYDLDNMYEDEKIYDNGIYTSTKSLIKNAYKSYQKENIFTAKVLLETALQKIRIATPEFVDQEYSNTLQVKIQLLLNSI